MVTGVPALVGDGRVMHRDLYLAHMYYQHKICTLTSNIGLMCHAHSTVVVAFLHAHNASTVGAVGVIGVGGGGVGPSLHSIQTGTEVLGREERQSQCTQWLAQRPLTKFSLRSGCVLSSPGGGSVSVVR